MNINVSNLFSHSYGNAMAHSSDERRSSQQPRFANLAKHISVHASIYAAILAVLDQEEKDRKRKHSFQLVHRRAVRALLSKIHNLRLDVLPQFKHETHGNNKPRVVKVSQDTRAIKVGKAAVDALMAGAESWVIANYSGVLDVVMSIMGHSPEDVS